MVDYDSSSSGESSESDHEEESQSDKTGSEMSIADMLKMREKIGQKAFDKKFNKKTKKQNSKIKPTQKEKNTEHDNKTFARANKNRPQEISSKRRVRKFGEKHPHRTRDPRFDELCGSQFDEDVFDARFSFLSNIRSKEKQLLNKKLHKARNPEQKEKIKFLVNRMDNQERAKKRKLEEKEVIQKWKHEEKSKVAQGKRPYFLKDSEKKKLISAHRSKNPVEKPKSSKNHKNRK